MCGHGIIAVTTIAIERELIVAGRTEPRARFAGRAESRRRRRAGTRPTSRGACRRSRSSTCRRSCFEAGLPVHGRRAGPCPSTSRSAAPSTPSSTPKPRACRSTAGASAGAAPRRAWRSRREVERLRQVVHPLDAGLEGHLRHDLHGAAAASGRAPAERDDLRRCRSRSIAVRHRHRGGDGGAERDGRARRRRAASSTRASSARCSPAASPAARRSASRPAIVPEIEGSAWITGEHTFLIDGDDPLKAGFRLLEGDRPKAEQRRKPAARRRQNEIGDGSVQPWPSASLDPRSPG